MKVFRSKSCVDVAGGRSDAEVEIDGAKADAAANERRSDAAATFICICLRWAGRMVTKNNALVHGHTHYHQQYQQEGTKPMHGANAT